MGLRVFLSGLILSIGLVSAKDTWPMFQHDHWHTGRSSCIGPSKSDTLWTYKTGNMISTSPIVDENQTVYVGTLGGDLIAIDSNGHKKWEYPTSNYVRSAPVLVGDGVCFGSYDKFFYKLGYGGNLIKKLDVGDAVKGAATLSGSNIVFPAGAKLVTISTDLQSNSEYPFPGNTSSSPAVGGDGTAYFQTDYGDEVLGVLAVLGGSQKWYFSTTRGGESGPAIGKNGIVYVGDYDGQLLAFEPGTGETLWARSIGNNIRSSPAIGANDTIYIGSDDYKLYAVAPDGSIAWSSPPTGDKIFAAPIIDGDGNIYIGSLDSTFYSYRSDGVLRWYRKLDGPIEQAAAIGPDGTVYVGTKPGTVWAFHSIVGIDEPAPTSFPLELIIAPNPLSVQASIEYRLPVNGKIALKIYDAAGGLVKTLFEGEQNPGNHFVVWNGYPTRPGVYFCRLTTPSGTTTKKIILLQ
jgi:outer membrane protein assembly factor BamB